MSAWFIYWILKLDAIGGVCIIISMLSFFGVIAGVITYLYWKERRPFFDRDGTEGNPSEYFVRIKRRVLSISKRGLISCIVLFCFVFPPTVLLPTTNQMCVIYLLPQIANNENIQKIPNNISELMNEKLEQWVDDI